MVLAAGDPLHQLIEGGSYHHSSLLVVAKVLLRVWAFVPNVDGVCGGEWRGELSLLIVTDIQFVTWIDSERYIYVYSTMQYYRGVNRIIFNVPSIMDVIDALLSSWEGDNINITLCYCAVNTTTLYSIKLALENVQLDL